MQTQAVPLSNLHLSPLNMRAEKKPPSVKRMAEIAPISCPPCARRVPAQIPKSRRRSIELWTGSLRSIRHGPITSVRPTSSSAGYAVAKLTLVTTSG